MPVTRQHLARLHPHFATDAHDDEDLAFWSRMAEIGLPASRFRGSVAQARTLYVAHQMAIVAHRKGKSSAEFSPEGRRRYMVFKSGGALPEEFDTPEQERPTAGAWNATSFGQQLHSLAKY